MSLPGFSMAMWSFMVQQVYWVAGYGFLTWICCMMSDWLTSDLGAACAWLATRCQSTLYMDCPRGKACFGVRWYIPICFVSRYLIIRYRRNR
jgi:hypothetical protein